MKNTRKIIFYLLSFFFVACEEIGTAKFDVPSVVSGGGGSESATLTFTGISSVTLLTYESARLNWVHDTYALFYEVYKINGTTPELLTILTAPTALYDLTGLSSNTSYTYKVIARDALGAYSSNTATTTITTLNEPVRLLTSHPAAAAFSLRQVKANAQYAIKVRRSSDNTTQDIGFSGEDLNLTALLAFVGNSDGFVHTWYDQSGNGHHAVNSTDAAQPQIVVAGNIILDDYGKPTLYFDGSNDSLTMATSVSATTLSMWLYTKMNDDGNNRGAWLAGVLTNDANRYCYVNDQNYILVNSTAPQNFTILRTIYDGSNVTIHENNVLKVSSPLTGSYAGLSLIGSNGGGRYFWGYMSELILFTSDKTSAVTTLETNIDAYYPDTSTYATFNSSYSNNFTFYHGKLMVAKKAGASNWYSMPATIGKTSGKWYFEVTHTAGSYPLVGIGTLSMVDYYVGNDSQGYGYAYSGPVYHGGSQLANFAAITAGDTVGVAMDLDNDLLYFYKNGSLQGSVSIADLDGATIYPFISQYQANSDMSIANFGATAFKYTVPSGFNAGVY